MKSKKSNMRFAGIARYGFVPATLLAAMMSLPASAQVAAEAAIMKNQALKSAPTQSRAVRPVTVGGGGAPAADADQGGVAGDNGPSCVGGLPDPVRVKMNAGKSTLINLPEPVTRRTVGDADVVDSRMVSTQVLYLATGRIGSTNVILQGRSGRCMLLDVVVGIDTDAVQAKLAELMPNEKNIAVTSAGDSIVLTGVVADAFAAERAVTIANAYVRTAAQQGLAKGGAGGTAAVGTTGFATQRAEAGGAPLLARVVNLLGVSAPQQVMLEVKVAEVSKTLIDKLGVGFSGERTNASWTYRLLSNFLTGTLAGGVAAGNGTNNFLQLEAEKRDALVRLLAEPNVMAISGQEGSFLAGGKILIPVAQSNNNGTATITLEEKEFGVGLKFTPTVLGDGRINLRVAPEVSELSREGVGISTASLTGTAILPLITTRRASTTVQLYDGQSFAIGGLIKNSGTTNLKAFPGLGEIPILGALFRSTDFQSEKTELVFVVTPRLVKPLPGEFELPTDRVGETNRKDLLLNGRLDSDGKAKPAPAPARGGMELK